MQYALNNFAVNSKELHFILFTSGLPDAYKKVRKFYFRERQQVMFLHQINKSCGNDSLLFFRESPIRLKNYGETFL